jgi:protein-L-isoaspartate(D-aspartate) O-methyltransferase
MPKLENSDFTAQHQVMLEVIAAYFDLSADRIERDRLGERVLAALSRVPRHKYVPDELQQIAYEDMPLPIGFGKTISQPFMVALMTDLLEIDEHDSVLEVGTGLGYQAAVLAELTDRVHTVEIIEELGRDGEKRLKQSGYGRVRVRIGDGTYGWPEHAPFDRIIVTAAPELIPTPLIEQLKPGGRMVVPAGLPDRQQLMLVEREPDGHVRTRELLSVRFSTLITSH